MADGKGKFTGGCHCGKIKYEIIIPIPTTSAPLQANRCNCSFCQKPGLTNLHLVEPRVNFKLVSPVDKATMGNYQPRTKTVDKYFCRECGVHVYMDGFYEVHGTKYDLFTVNLHTIDQPQEGLDLSKVQLKYVDMLHDNFMGGTKDEPWPSGLP